MFYARDDLTRQCDALPPRHGVTRPADQPAPAPRGTAVELAEALAWTPYAEDYARTEIVCAVAELLEAWGCPHLDARARAGGITP